VGGGWPFASYAGAEVGEMVEGQDMGRLQKGLGRVVPAAVLTAEAEAAQIRARAEEEAVALRSEAQATRAQAERAGFEAGKQEGLAQVSALLLAARAQAGGSIDRAAADTAGFRFARLTAWDDPDFLPGGAKYLDLPGMAALSAPWPLWLAGEGAEPPPVVAAAYHAAGAPQALAVSAADESAREAAAVEWLSQ